MRLQCFPGEVFQRGGYARLSPPPPAPPSPKSRQVARKLRAAAAVKDALKLVLVGGEPASATQPS